MANHFQYIIVGGGLAGATATEGIRERDRTGSVALFGKEQHLPYDRPPLSKGLWSGRSKLDSLPIHDEAFYKSYGVHLFLGREITTIDRKKKQIFDREGDRFTYDKLLLTTGGAPRTLSFGEGAVHYYRTIDDYLSLRKAAEQLEQFLLIGGGFIGAELAAALTQIGKNVTMAFPDHVLLQRVLPEDLALFVTDYYREKGVKIVNDDVPTGIERSNGMTIATTKGGLSLQAEIAVAAIGLNLHTEMAKRAGLKIENGIAVNTFLQTSDPDIYAAGDIASFPSPSLEKTVRVEHWNNAQVQGKHAGENMAGANKPYTYVPYFYSDLFDLGFEAVGELDPRLKTFADWKEEFREGVVYYIDNGRVKGVLLWNVWEKVDAARDLINRKKIFNRLEDLRDRM